MADDEGDFHPAKSERQAKKNARIHQLILKNERNATTRRISTIIRKSVEERTEEENELLDKSPELAHRLTKQAVRRDTLKQRHLEVEDDPQTLDAKCQQLADSIRKSSRTIIYTGAGISTAASIPDYRGPNGIWTLLKKGKTPLAQDLSDAEPTLTHMSIVKLYTEKHVKHVVSQNCDGLHVRSGLPREALSEVHGNMFVETCSHCSPEREYIRLFDVTEKTGIRRHKTDRNCHNCGKGLKDTIVHFGEKGGMKSPYRWKEAAKAANSCDLILCLGTSLKILKKYACLWCMHKRVHKRPELYIVNLQWTPKDDVAKLKINGRCDEVMAKVMKMLGLTIPMYQREKDPLFTLCTPLRPMEIDSTSKKILSIATCPNIEVKTEAPAKQDSQQPQNRVKIEESPTEDKSKGATMQHSLFPVLGSFPGVPPPLGLFLPPLDLFLLSVMHRHLHVATSSQVINQHSNGVRSVSNQSTAKSTSESVHRSLSEFPNLLSHVNMIPWLAGMCDPRLWSLPPPNLLGRHTQNAQTEVKPPTADIRNPQLIPQRNCTRSKEVQNVFKDHSYLSKAQMERLSHQIDTEKVSPTPPFPNGTVPPFSKPQNGMVHTQSVPQNGQASNLSRLLNGLVPPQSMPVSGPRPPVLNQSPLPKPQNEITSQLSGFLNGMKPSPLKASSDHLPPVLNTLSSPIPPSSKTYNKQVTDPSGIPSGLISPQPKPQNAPVLHPQEVLSGFVPPPSKPSNGTVSNSVNIQIPPFSLLRNGQVVPPGLLYGQVPPQSSKLQNGLVPPPQSLLGGLMPSPSKPLNGSVPPVSNPQKGIVPPVSTALNNGSGLAKREGQPLSSIYDNNILATMNMLNFMKSLTIPPIVPSKNVNASLTHKVNPDTGSSASNIGSTTAAKNVNGSVSNNCAENVTSNIPQKYDTIPVDRITNSETVNNAPGDAKEDKVRKRKSSLFPGWYGKGLKKKKS